MDDRYDRLQHMDITLPPVEKPKGATLAGVCFFAKNLVYCSGCGARDEHGERVTGRVSILETTDRVRIAARTCVLRHIAQLHAATGDLNRIKQIVKVTAFVNCEEGFTAHETTMSEAQKLILDVFGQTAGSATWTTIGVPVLPNDGICEIEMLVELFEE